MSDDEPYVNLCRLIERRREQANNVTFIVGIAGSVAVGKSTTARVLQSLLAEGPDRPSVERISTDGFLYPNAVLEARHLLHRKGFPETYDRARLVGFLREAKASTGELSAPTYDHRIYDVIPDAGQPLGQPDILLLEGLNVLQSGPPPMVSDYLDLTVYVDAATRDIRDWYVERFLALTRAAASDPGSFYAPWAGLADDEIRAFASGVWTHVNEVNLTEHILPTRARADVVISKGPDHRVVDVQVRRFRR